MGTIMDTTSYSVVVKKGIFYIVNTTYIDLRIESIIIMQHLQILISQDEGQESSRETSN